MRQPNKKTALSIKGIMMVSDKPDRNGIIYTKENMEELVKSMEGKKIPVYDGYDENVKPKKKIGEAKLYFDGEKLMMDSVLDKPVLSLKKLPDVDVKITM